ncbi:putative Rab5 family GTPase [Planoprotostelium fungivorum]|uniref:Putative Rab5 family GTPase n=1 Tax=Planoprotostelium fungivorum TaxID=1890364 RepID=A0A2P6NRK6_9EUKA|nr:putative Rab5 family GTPase [Planoprotostelium fungivorum]
MSDPSGGDLYESKIVLLGDTGVGKTSLVLRYVEQRFATQQLPTIGASFLSRTIWVDDIRIKLQLWDTAGQERFRSLAPMYYRGASVALVVYHVCNRESFEMTKSWIEELRSNNENHIIVAIVGNQIDRTDRIVTEEEGRIYAESIEARYFETSAKKDVGVEDMFLQIAKELTKRVQKSSESVSEFIQPSGRTGGCSC